MPNFVKKTAVIGPFTVVASGYDEKGKGYHYHIFVNYDPPNMPSVHEKYCIMDGADPLYRYKSIDDAFSDALADLGDLLDEINRKVCEEDFTIENYRAPVKYGKEDRKQ